MRVHEHGRGVAEPRVPAAASPVAPARRRHATATASPIPTTAAPTRPRRATAIRTTTAARSRPAPPASPNDIGRIVERIGFPYDSAELKPALVSDARRDRGRAQDAAAAVSARRARGTRGRQRARADAAVARARVRRARRPARARRRRRPPARARVRARWRPPACSRTRRAGRANAPSNSSRCPARSRPPRRRRRRHPEPRAEPGRQAARAERAAPAIPLERVEFNRGSAVLAPSALANLDLLAGFMKANAASLEIVGYADERERGVATLAQARADAVRGYMMACGVSGAHLVTRAERTGRAACRSHSAKCPARDGRAELRFVEPPARRPRPRVTPRRRRRPDAAGRRQSGVETDAANRRSSAAAGSSHSPACGADGCTTVLRGVDSQWKRSDGDRRAIGPAAGIARAHRPDRVELGAARRRRRRRARARAGAVRRARCGSRETPPPDRTGSRRR